VACHKPIGDRIASEKKHEPVEDCLTCHDPHGSGQSRLLAQPVAQVCDQCHSANDKALAAAHLGIDLAKIACASCHDPHASKDPKLFKRVGHAPFMARQCDACHNLAQGGGKR